jgi:predicted nicotinamide N-methyase
MSAHEFRRKDMIPDPEAFIRANMALAPAPGAPEIMLYTTHPSTGLSLLLVDDDTPPPYWAYAWAGGCALARHVLDHPETVAGLRIVDLGAGGGIVGVAAAMAGARSVTALDSHPFALVAARMNGAANGVEITSIAGDLSATPPDADLILAGDVFYDPELARQVVAYLDRCLDAGVRALVGDPFRAHLPLHRLDLLAEYSVPDVGDAIGGMRSGVFAFKRPA